MLRMLGGGASRPSLLCAAAVALVMTLSTPLAAAPRTEDELIALVRTAIEKQDYDAIEPLVNWQGSGPRNKRLVAMQIRHGLGRPVKSIKLEPAGPDVTADVSAQHPDFALNMPVTHLLRVAFADGEGQPGQGDPGTVFLIGQSSEGEFRIALVVRKAQPK
jgi:hypothetical protein